VINFKDRALDPEHDDPKNLKGSPYARDYPDCLSIVEENVTPERQALKDTPDSRRFKEKWWQYGRTRPELHAAIAGLDQVLAISLVNNHLGLLFVPTNWVLAHKLAVFPFDTYASFSVLQSGLHYVWAWNYSSTNLSLLNYSPSDCFETFPFPTFDPSDLSTQFPTLNTIGETYYTHRQTIMHDRQQGLTKTYNRFHDTHETDRDIQKLRSLHIEMDNAVAIAYGWELDLEHGFHKTKQGDRFTISENARREVLDRLLALNHQRYAEEVEQGLHDKKNKKAKGKASKKQQPPSNSDQDEQISLF
jgi:hypothetical protein